MRKILAFSLALAFSLSLAQPAQAITVQWQHSQGSTRDGAHGSFASKSIYVLGTTHNPGKISVTGYCRVGRHRHPRELQVGVWSVKWHVYRLWRTWILGGSHSATITLTNTLTHDDKVRIYVYWAGCYATERIYHPYGPAPGAKNVSV
jgi:hypothetical protein